MPDEDVTVKAIFAEIKDAPNDDDMNVKRDIHFVLVKTDGNGVGVAYPPYSEGRHKGNGRCHCEARLQVAKE